MHTQVAERIRAGEHRRATFTTNVSWASRLLYGGRVMDLWEQRLFLRLLAQLWPQRMLPALVRLCFFFVLSLLLLSMDGHDAAYRCHLGTGGWMPPRWQVDICASAACKTAPMNVHHCYCTLTTVVLAPL